MNRSLHSVAIRLLLITVALAFIPGILFGRDHPAPSRETIVIDTRAPVHPFPHYWEQMFGSGRATLSLRSSYRKDLRAVKRVTDFRYVRFHGIFDDDVGIYSDNAQGQPVYNFSYVDQIYDGLLENGIRPFVELSFMPKVLASTSERQAFFYHPYISPPKDWNLWGDLVRHFAEHLIARYGIDEVSQWYFEVWNEPNISFWSGEPKQETYFHLYDVTARALKSVSPRLRVGGPATAQAAWISAFVEHCAKDHVPVDFVSTHVYGDDSAENVFGTHQHISRRDMVVLAVKKVYDEVKASPMPGLPVIFSEYNASYMNLGDVTDSPFMGPWLAETISRCDGLVKMLSYWDFSDVFEEQGVVKSPFYGGYGLIAAGHIPKASYNDFALLHRLGGERIAVKVGPVIATRRADGALAIALWNYAPPGPGGETKAYTLRLAGLAGSHRAVIWKVDRRHGSPQSTWVEMGKPDFPSQAQQQILREAGQMTPPVIEPVSGDQVSLALLPHALALIEIVK